MSRSFKRWDVLSDAAETELEVEYLFAPACGSEPPGVEILAARRFAHGHWIGADIPDADRTRIEAELVASHEPDDEPDERSAADLIAF